MKTSFKLSSKCLVITALKLNVVLAKDPRPVFGGFPQTVRYEKYKMWRADGLNERTKTARSRRRFVENRELIHVRGISPPVTLKRVSITLL